MIDKPKRKKSNVKWRLKNRFRYSFASIKDWPPCLTAVQPPPEITCTADVLVHLLQLKDVGTFSWVLL